jgi:hypothetical protein
MGYPWLSSWSKPDDPAPPARCWRRFIALDRCAEEPSRRLVSLQDSQGRLDAVGATWWLVRRRLAELDVDVDATVRLYHA